MNRAASLCALGIAALSSVAQGAEPSVEATSARVAPSVVRLAMMSRGKEVGNGTGFFVADGVVVTNHHVIDDVEDELQAVFADGKKVRVTGVLADDPAHDLALVRVVGGGFPVLTLAPPGELHVGQRVTAVGSPLGFDQTVSSGIISAIRDDYPPAQKEDDPTLLDKKGPLVQHTAAIAPGSSGSPLVDDAARVVGVNHSGFPGTSLFFAAHVDSLRELLAKTDLKAAPKPLGANVRRNLLISGAFALALVASWIIATRVSARRRQRYH